MMCPADARAQHTAKRALMPRSAWPRDARRPSQTAKAASVLRLARERLVVAATAAGGSSADVDSAGILVPHGVGEPVAPDFARAVLQLYARTLTLAEPAELTRVRCLSPKRTQHGRPPPVVVAHTSSRVPPSFPHWPPPLAWLARLL